MLLSTPVAVLRFATEGTSAERSADMGRKTSSHARHVYEGTQGAPLAGIRNNAQAHDMEEDNLRIQPKQCEHLPSPAEALSKLARVAAEGR